MMNPLKKFGRMVLPAILVATLDVSESFGSADVDDGFSRYQIIISRKPFGVPPPEPVEVKEPPPKAQEDSFAKTMRVFGINKPEGGMLEVGIWDNATQSHFLLHEGESNDDGVKVVSVNYELEEVILEKAGEVAVITLTNQIAKASAKARPKGAKPQKGQNKVVSAKPGITKATSYRSRRKARRAEKLEEVREAVRLKKEALANPPKYTKEELRARLEDYNMEVIRQGLPPLPVELTKAQDDQLVREGYLPPMEGQQNLNQPDAGAMPAGIGQIPVDQLTAEDIKALEELGILK